MTDAGRDALIARFLERAGWGDGVRLKLAGDASFRRYERIARGKDVAVLMDAPPPKEDVQPFILVDEYLVALGYSAPKILARDEAAGLLLLEDLGDTLFSRVLADPSSAVPEKTLYLAATDWLVDVYRRSRDVPPALPPYSQVLMPEVSLFAEWYLPQVMPVAEAKARQDEFTLLWQSVFDDAELPENVFVHRDYHADNLLWLPERKGAARVGLLDFQDARLGASAYDMVSFLEDARRDVEEATVSACLAHYLKETGQQEKRFMRDYAVLGAQRNCKIVGIFTRLAVRDGKHHYLKLLPRVWGHLQHDLRHPFLEPVALWMERHIAPEWRGEIAVRARA